MDTQIKPLITRRSITIVVFSIIVYIVVYLIVFPFVGLPGALLLVPALVAGLLLGIRGGMVVGLFLVILTIGMNVAMTGSWQRVLDTWLGFAIAAPVAAVFGWLREQADRLMLQARDLEKARAELINLNAGLEKRVAERTAEVDSLNAGLERRVKERTEQLTQANAQLEAFSNMVAHDLRNPLTMVQSYSDLLITMYAGKPLEGEAREMLDAMNDATQRMAQLIQDLFDFSHSSQGELEHKQVDLRQMAFEAAEELNRHGGDRQIQFTVSPTLTANGDERFLRVLLDNLLGNAWKYTSHRGQANVELGVVQGGDGPVYFVRDNGAGFDMARATELFTPFKRLHSTDQFTGTGLGLATCKRIVERHGGNIWVESQAGVGTTFYFTLGTPSPN